MLPNQAQGFGFFAHSKEMASETILLRTVSNICKIFLLRFSYSFSLNYCNPRRDFIDVVWKLWEDRREIGRELLVTIAW